MTRPRKIVIAVKIKRRSSCKCKPPESVEASTSDKTTQPESQLKNVVNTLHKNASKVDPETTEVKKYEPAELKNDANILLASGAEPQDTQLIGGQSKARPTNAKYKMSNLKTPSGSGEVYDEDDHEPGCCSCFSTSKSSQEHAKPAASPDKGSEKKLKGHKRNSIIPEQPNIVKPEQIEFSFSKNSYVETKASVNKNLSFTPNKLYNLGERGSGFKTKGEPQDFYKLRDDCLAQGILFEDPEFPAVPSSINCCDNDESLKQLATVAVWKRPKEIVQNPKLFINGYSRFDVEQGALGDCWLLAALANLTIYTKLFSQIVPDDQGFDQKYAGIFHFRFWQYGRWIDVVVDDRIPTRYGTLPFLHSSDPNEFWSALIEKAYAKLAGSYDALVGGLGSEASTDLTGGIKEDFDMAESPPDFFNVLLKAYARASLMTCSLKSNPNVTEALTPEGLVQGHAYSITKVASVAVRGNLQVNLIRLRNPWGNEIEWKGAWSDRSVEWDTVTNQEKQKIGLIFENDGEFWMSFNDFQSRFAMIDICNLNPDCLLYPKNGGNKKWQMSTFQGEWVRGVTAGGCRKFPDTFHCNPQYRITLSEIDEGDNKCTLVVALMKTHRRALVARGKKRVFMGFLIFQIPNPSQAPTPLDSNYLKTAKIVGAAKGYACDRESSRRFKLPPATYVVIPTTWDPNEEAEFLIRAFTENKIALVEHDNEELLHSVPPLMAAPQVEDEVSKLFQNVAGQDGEVDWQELKNILDSSLAGDTRDKEFSSDTCRSMIAMLDTDFSGKLNETEFKKLWNRIIHWKEVFHKFDKDHSGTFSGFELRGALLEAGFTVNNRILNKLMMRYGNKKGELDFEDFIMCAIKIKTLIDLFEYKAADKKIAMEIDEWLELTISAS